MKTNVQNSVRTWPKGHGKATHENDVALSFTTPARLGKNSKGDSRLVILLHINL
jgi:hypothetical protein